MAIDTEVNPAEARLELERVAQSQAFQEAETLRRLLLYLGEATLDARAEHLKEYTVGVECLGRPSHYDPRTDSSARMLAARLRRKLEDYYRNEGAADAVRIGFPKGGFKLAFEATRSVPAAPDRSRELKLWRLLSGAGLCGCILLGALALSRSGGRLAPADAGWTPALEAFWQPLLADSTPIVISFGSPLFFTQRGLAVRPSEVNDMAELPAFPVFKDLAPVLPLAGWKPDFEYAGIGDVHGAFMVARLLAARKRQLVLKRGLVLSWEDIKNDHLVFIGNGKNQEKLRELLTNRDFTLSEPVIRNIHPRPGEPTEFSQVRDKRTGEITLDYAMITFLPGIEQGRYMFVLSAGSTETIGGAVEAVTNPKFAASLVAHLRSGGSMPKAYQLVAKIRMNAGVPVEISYATHHVLSSSDSR